ncbi:hypothetical protein SELMODRAFT_233289 [Selaginella moellendorffii]|uniref:Uncharacterized protein n=1 Tax=Selaginella moellendorffii TaxID=88036 RepID=D8S7D3_SELML|nr:mitochondrial uncoupling protein 5 [Selaginella moellendorffii]XP_002988639.1 mitochondrial uncoupling protein 5 [Selaginella moellendorffii]EFJ10435.1 hypothetical protein SELMODRAFT_128340 [Selaginella moellendorffii]EFJ19737.1 hypothetical protein SELMODRAFT_233289 [Selaginella moellendorffii]|eukprot:XP_002979329.1 mitochondrial uncoupling protein 5 [Selaginella moellendorffii]
MGWKGFVEGWIASVVAGVSTHPLDLIKVRMQLQGEQGKMQESYMNPFVMGAKLVRAEGFAGLYAGVSAAMLRQTLYASTRLGIYDMLKHRLSGDSGSGGGVVGGADLPLFQKVAAALIAGGIGAAAGNPADVVMVRMQADGRLPAKERRSYRNAFDALSQMVRNEGILSLWRGSSLTVQRAMIVTAVQLASYDHVKETLAFYKITNEGIATHLVASLTSGFLTSVVSEPIDVIKTRVMNMKVVFGKTPPYRNAIDCAMKTIRSEGVLALYKGLLPCFARQGPFAVVLFITLEQTKEMLKDF